MHAPNSAVFSLFVLPLSFFLSVLFLLLVSYYSPVVGFFPFWSFLFLGPSLWVFTTLLPWVFPLKCFPPLSLPLSVFFSLPCFSFPPFFFPPFFAMVTSSFYSQLIQWDFSLLPLRLHQLFLVCCGHPFKITHPPIGCTYHCSVHVCCTVTHFTTKFHFVCFCCIPLPLGSN